MLAVTAAACMMPLMPYVRCGGMHDAPSISSAGIVPADRPDQRPLPNARSRMPFQSGLTVSGVAAFMPAVLAADWTVLELAAPVLPGLGVSTQKGPSSPTTE